MEVLGKDTTKIQLNYFTNGVGGHETTKDLGFDASMDYHLYAFEWEPNAIRWYVDDMVDPFHTETGMRGPLPTRPGKIMMNMWKGDQSVLGWLGPFTYSRTTRCLLQGLLVHRV
jgi:beta-glucanase (GH16 family)